MPRDEALASSDTVAPSSNPPGSSLVGAILLAGLLGGGLDIVAAMTAQRLVSGGDPLQLLRGIAGGAFGPARASAGGLPMAAAGLGFHFAISYTFTIAWFMLAPRIGVLARRPLLAAWILGTAVWATMNLAVVPWAFDRPFRFNLVPVARGYAILVVCFALPVTLVARRHFFSPKKIA
jgi:hypothetical protein